MSRKIKLSPYGALVPLTPLGLIGGAAVLLLLIAVVLLFSLPARAADFAAIAPAIWPLPLDAWLKIAAVAMVGLALVLAYAVKHAHGTRELLFATWADKVVVTVLRSWGLPQLKALQADLSLPDGSPTPQLDAMLTRALALLKATPVGPALVFADAIVPKWEDKFERWALSAVQRELSAAIASAVA